MGIGECFDCIGNRAIINQGSLISAAIFDMAVQRVIAGIDLAPGEPAIKWRVPVIKNAVPFAIP